MTADRLKPLYLLVPRAGVEPARYIIPRDFKSLVSTNFTTRALVELLKKRKAIMSMRPPLLGHDFRKKQPILSLSFHHPARHYFYCLQISFTFFPAFGPGEVTKISVILSTTADFAVRSGFSALTISTAMS